MAALALTSILTYPLVPGASHQGRLNTDDGRYSIWNVAWVSHALLTHPSRLFDANIFYPLKDTLAFSEANIVAGVIALPAWAATGNPHLAHNSAAIASFVLSLVSMYLLVMHLAGRKTAAFVSGTLFAFCPFIFARTAHIQLLMTWGLPLSLLAYHRLLDAPGPRRALALGVVLWAQALACAYYGIFAALVLGLGTLYFSITRRLWRTPQTIGFIALAAVVSLALTAPFFIPYVRVQDAGFARTLADARMYSANAGAWLASASWAHRWWLPAIEGFNEVLFPGLLVTGLAVIGAWRLWHEKAQHSPASRLDRETAGFYLLVAVTAFWASFGPDAGLYRALFATVPTFDLLRAPARFGILVTLSLAVLSAPAVTHMLAMSRRPRLLATALILAAAADLMGAPYTGYRKASPVPAAYRVLAQLPRGAVAEFPYFYERMDFPRHAGYMLGSTYHWQPLVNGYSDYIPRPWRDHVRQLSSFPSRESFGILGRLGARYVVFHLQMYDRRSRQRLMERLDTYGRFLRPIIQQDDVWLYEIVDWPN